MIAIGQEFITFCDQCEKQGKVKIGFEATGNGVDLRPVITSFEYGWKLWNRFMLCPDCVLKRSPPSETTRRTTKEVPINEESREKVDGTQYTESSRRKGLMRKYLLARADGTDVDPDGMYFVLKLNSNDPYHAMACQEAALMYANHIYSTHPKLAADLRTCVYALRHDNSGPDRWQTAMVRNSDPAPEDRGPGECDE